MNILRRKEARPMGGKVREHKGMVRHPAFGLLTLLIFLSMAVTAVAGQFADADAAYARGDYATAYRLLKPLAEQGNARAQYDLGFMHEKGQGVPKDDVEAAKWYRKAAEQGNAIAQVNLGFMYDKGQGVPKDDVEAAKRWRKAAEEGFARAQYNLGFMYDTGQGVPKDYIQAYMWFSIAASRFHESERENRELAVKSRNLVASKMTPAQIAEAQRLAKEWKPTKMK